MVLQSPENAVKIHHMLRTHRLSDHNKDVQDHIQRDNDFTTQIYIHSYTYIYMYILCVYIYIHMYVCKEVSYRASLPA